MQPDPLQTPKVLLWHDLTFGGRLDEASAARRFDRQLERIASSGLGFATMDAFIDGRLGTRNAIVTFDDGLRSFRDVAFPVLERHGVRATLFVVSTFAEQTGPGGPFLSWSEVRDLAKAGVDIGCHAATHVPLNEIPAERMLDEIADPTRRFREEGFEPTVFAYPFGRYDESVKKAVAAAGYRAAFTVMKGGAGRFEIRRRLLTGAEGASRLALLLSDGFFDVRDGARRFVPKRLLKQENPIAPSRWGAEGFGPAANRSTARTDR